MEAGYWRQGRYWEPHGQDEEGRGGGQEAGHRAREGREEARQSILSVLYTARWGRVGGVCGNGGPARRRRKVRSGCRALEVIALDSWLAPP